MQPNTLFAFKIYLPFTLVAFALMLTSGACNQNSKPNSTPITSTLNGHDKMLATIAQVSRQINVSTNGYSAEAKLAMLDSLIQVSRNVNDRLNNVLKKGMVLLEYGDEAKAVSTLEDVLKYVGQHKEARIPTLYWLATAYMRLAERTNCVAGHTAEACIMPLRGTGVHKNQTPSRIAINLFQDFLKEAPDDPNHYDGVWLLNVAYMTVGEYPAGVPKQWLIPGLDKPDYVVKPFTDVASKLNLAVNNRAGGSIIEDFDNDGDLDLVTSGWDIGVDAMHYFRNNGDGTFTERSTESGLSKFCGGLNIQQTDYNNDGKIDIWVLRGAWQGQFGSYGEQPNSLLRNNGDGTFTDVTIDAGLLSFCPTQTSVWVDFNNDGWLDLFIGNESSDQNSYDSELYINNQNGTFTNKIRECGVRVNMFIKGVTAGDYDNDGWMDLFLSTMNGNKMLLHNKGANTEGRVRFEDMTEKSGFAKENYRSFTTFFFDYDNDGWLDLFVCNYNFEKALSYYFAREGLGLPSKDEGKPCIYHNNHDGTFTNATPTLGPDRTCFSMGGNFGDFNNDGFLDIYLGTGNPNYQSIVPNKMFINLNGRKFADATVSSRTGNLQKGHAVSIADLDNDGDQDIHIEMGGAYRGDGYPNSLYLNPGQNNNRWIYLQMEGSKCNKPAIGSKITVKFTENGKQRMVYREMNSGGSFGSSPFRREIGVGQASMIDEISIVWPGNSVPQVFKNIKPNQLLKIKEGQENYETLTMQKMDFTRPGADVPMCVPTK